MSAPSFSDPRADWWAEDLQEERYRVAWGALETLRTLQSARLSAGLLYESIYEQRNPYTSMDSGASFAGNEAGFWLNQSDEIGLLTYNALQINADTLVSKLMQADPQIKCQTDNANFETRQKAELLERVIRASFNESKYYEIKEECDLDMILFGFGAMRFDIDHVNKRPWVYRVHPLDIWWDVLEARDMPPLTMYTVRLVSKASLKEEYPEMTVEIDQATIGGNRSLYAMRGIDPNSMCEQVECWRRPAIPGGKPGMYMKSLSSCELESEPWERDFPFAFSYWTKRRRGPYPIPAAEQVVFLQRNLNRLIEREHECIYTLATPRLILDEHTGVPPSQFQTNGISDIIQGDFTGRPIPQIMNAHVVPDDIRIAIAQTKQDIANIFGTNALESVGDKPVGLVTQPGLSEYTNQAGVRHFKTLKENERATVRAAEKLLETLRELKETYGSISYLTEAMGEYETVDFADADLPPSALKIELAPANLLPLMPSGRLDKIVQLAQTGAFQPKHIMRLFQSPDVTSAVSDETQSEKEIEWMIYEMSKANGRYLGPTEHDDLTLGIERVNLAWQRARRQGQSGTVQARFEQWVAEALLLQQQQQDALLQRQMAVQQMQQAQSQTTQMQAAQGVRQAGNQQSTPQ